MAQVNQQSLAKALNLSQTTVSRALMNHPSINAETKAQVWSLAAELGYSIGNAKRSVGRSKGSRPTVIGVMIAIPERERGPYETSQAVLRGIAERSANETVTLDIIYQEPSEADARAVQRRLRQRQWQGCILIHPMKPELVARIARTLPCVSVIENYRQDYIDSIDVDQTEAIAMLVRALHRRGHRRIGFLSWVYDVPTPWVYHRFGAYVETLFQLGLDLHTEDTINIREGERFTPEEAAERIIVARERGVTAFVCAADHQAYRMWQLLEARGVKVPGDLSLTGFDGIPPPRPERQVATIAVPYDEIGRSAFHQILHRTAFPSAPRRHVMVDGDLVEGVSMRASDDDAFASNAVA